MIQKCLHRHCHKVCGQGVGTHQMVHMTNGSVEDNTQHTRDKKLVQHLVHKVQFLHHQDGQK